MPTYQYRCPDHGLFEEKRLVSEAMPQRPCPVCGKLAGRHYSAPMLARISTRTRRSLDAEARNREQPAVVHSIRPRPGKAPAITRNPKHRKLPRP